MSFLYRTEFPQELKALVEAERILAYDELQREVAGLETWQTQGPFTRCVLRIFLAFAGAACEFGKQSRHQAWSDRELVQRCDDFLQATVIDAWEDKGRLLGISRSFTSGTFSPSLNPEMMSRLKKSQEWEKCQALLLDALRTQATPKPKTQPEDGEIRSEGTLAGSESAVPQRPVRTPEDQLGTVASEEAAHSWQWIHAEFLKGADQYPILHAHWDSREDLWTFREAAPYETQRFADPKAEALFKETARMAVKLLGKSSEGAPLWHVWLDLMRKGKRGFRRTHRRSWHHAKLILESEVPLDLPSILLENGGIAHVFKESADFCADLDLRQPEEPKVSSIPPIPDAPRVGADIKRKGDLTLLAGRELVAFKTAEQYLGISERQRQNLMERNVLEVKGMGQNRKITAESLLKYLPPENPK